MDPFYHIKDEARADVRNADLEAELELYRDALKLACEAVESWGAYAGEYFQEKWNWKADCEPETHLTQARMNRAQPPS